MLASLLGLTHSTGVPLGTVHVYLHGFGNLARFDRLVQEETSLPQNPSGVSVVKGIQLLFNTPNYDASLSSIVTGIRYRAAGAKRTPRLEPRIPGSGIRRFIDLNSSQKTARGSLAAAYTVFSTTDSGLEQLETSLRGYLEDTIGLGRRLSPEELWDYLQKGRPGFPVHEVMIEAIGVRSEDFNQTMERAASAGLFGESLQNSEFRSRRRQELEARWRK
jgi:hypothetical protein